MLNALNNLGKEKEFVLKNLRSLCIGISGVQAPPHEGQKTPIEVSLYPHMERAGPVYNELDEDRDLVKYIINI